VVSRSPEKEFSSAEILHQLLSLLSYNDSKDLILPTFCKLSFWIKED
jgi:hypothetical protein